MKLEVEIVRFDTSDIITTSGCATPMECGCFSPNPAVVANV